MPTAPLQTPEMTLSSSSRGPSSFVGHVVNESRHDLPQFNELQLADTDGSLEGTSRSQQVHHRRRRQPSSSLFSPSSEALLSASAPVENTLRRLHGQVLSGSQRSSASAEGQQMALARAPGDLEADPVSQWLQHLATSRSSLGGFNGENPTSSSVQMGPEELDSLMMSRKSLRSTSLTSSASSLVVYGGARASATSSTLLSPKHSPWVFTAATGNSRRSVSRTPSAAGGITVRQPFLFPSLTAEDVPDDHVSSTAEFEQPSLGQDEVAPIIFVTSAATDVPPFASSEDGWLW